MFYIDELAVGRSARYQFLVDFVAKIAKDENCFAIQVQRNLLNFLFSIWRGKQEVRSLKDAEKKFNFSLQLV